MEFPTHCEEVLRLRAEMEVMKEWKENLTEEVMELKATVHAIQRDTQAHFLWLLGFGITTLLATCSGLLYIIMSHALM